MTEEEEKAVKMLKELPDRILGITLPFADFDYEWALNVAVKAIEQKYERKKGRLIRKPIRNNKCGCASAEMICTYCGEDNELDKKLSFCPNCGAEMESEE